MAVQGMEQVLPTIKHYGGYILHRYKKLPILGKLFIWLVILFYICAGAFILWITPARLAQYLYDYAKMLAATRYGWLALGGAIVFISFPPLVGHTTLSSLCGFAYGLKGFWIASIGSLLGAVLSFIVLRLLFKQQLRAWSNKNDKWRALESVVRAKGLPLIILIRISPFPPWVYSNSLFASIQPVKVWQFAIATCFVFPKLLLHVFIGSRIAALSDGETRGHMDTQTKIINGCVVAGGIILAGFTSWTVYNMVQKHIRHLDGIPPEVDELAAEAIEDYGESEPLLRTTSPPPV